MLTGPCNHPDIRRRPRCRHPLHQGLGQHTQHHPVPEHLIPRLTPEQAQLVERRRLEGEPSRATSLSPHINSHTGRIMKDPRANLSLSKQGRRGSQPQDPPQLLHRQARRGRGAVPGVGQAGQRLRRDQPAAGDAVHGTRGQGRAGQDRDQQGQGEPRVGGAGLGRAARGRGREEQLDRPAGRRRGGRRGRPARCQGRGGRCGGGPCL